MTACTPISGMLWETKQPPDLVPFKGCFGMLSVLPDDEYSKFQNYLIAKPDAGALIIGGSGLRQGAMERTRTRKK